MSYCTDCGSKFESGERFCGNCGKGQQVKVMPVVEGRPNQEPKRQWLFGIVGLVVLAIAIGTAIFLIYPDIFRNDRYATTIVDENQPTEPVLEDGAAVVVAPGSLPAGATIVIRRLAPAESPVLPDGFDSTELLYDISIDQPLEKEITLRFPIPEVTEESVFQFSRYRNGQWEPVAFIVEDGFAVVQTDTLSIWGWLQMRAERFAEWVDVKIMTYANSDTYINWYREATGLDRYMELPLEGASDFIDFDDSKARNLISASAQIIEDDRMRLRVRNNTNLYLRISFDGAAPVEPERGAYISANDVAYLFATKLIISPEILDLQEEFLPEEVLLLPEGTAEFYTVHTPNQALNISAQFCDVAALFSCFDPLLGLVPMADLEMFATVRDVFGEGSRFVQALPELEKGWNRHVMNLLDVAGATNRAGVLTGETVGKDLAKKLILPAAVNIRENYMEGRVTSLVNKGADAKFGGAITLVMAAPKTFAMLDFPGAMFTEANGINDAGYIVGAYEDADGSQRGFLFDGMHFQALNFPGATLTEAHGINNIGQIVGMYEDADGRQRGFLFDGTRYMTLDFPGAKQTYANVINDGGQIVGYYRDAEWRVRGFIFDGIRYLTLEFPGATFTDAHGINDAGNIVGYYRDADGKWYGFLFDGISYQSLDFPGARGTYALGINDADQIVGMYEDVNGRRRGFLFDGAHYQTLDFPGSTFTNIHSINNAGQIVGIYEDADGRRRGFHFGEGFIGQ